MCVGANLSSQDVGDKPNFPCLHLKILLMQKVLPTQVWLSSLDNSICSWGVGVGMTMIIFMGYSLVMATYLVPYIEMRVCFCFCF